MSYTVEHKIGKYIYICRITSFWDKGKKQPRQNRQYISRKDPKTGKIFPLHSHNLPVISHHYGATSLLYHIADSIELTKILQETFPKQWQNILACAFYQIIEKRPLYLCEQWAEITYLFDRSSLTSQRISELLQSLGEQYAYRLQFFRNWAKMREEKEYIAFDITSISSYSELIEWVEYGYNRDKENLPQINLGMLFGYTSMLPVFYTLYPGSIKDVSTIKNMISFVNYLEIRNVIFVFDKGFYSERNIEEMLKKRRNFLISVPFTVKAAYELVERYIKEIDRMKNSFIINDNVGYGIETKIKIGNRRLRAYVYIDKRKKLQAEEELVKKIKDIEAYIENLDDKNLKEVEAYCDENYKGWRNICFIEKKGEKFILQQNEKGIRNKLQLEGCMVVISNCKMKAQESLSLYRDKDIVEKAFDNLKNELDTNRLRVHKDISAQGRIFISFVALILYSAINKIMKDNNLYERYTFDEMIRELHKICLITIGKKKIFTELTKKQKELMKIFKISLES